MSKPTVNLSLEDNLTMEQLTDKIVNTMDYCKRWEFKQKAKKETTILDLIEVATEYVEFDIPKMEIVLKFEEMDSMDLAILFGTLYEEGWSKDIENIWGILDHVDLFDCEVEIYIKRKSHKQLALLPTKNITSFLDKEIYKEYIKANPGVAFLAWVLNKHPEEYKRMEEIWQEKNT